MVHLNNLLEEGLGLIRNQNSNMENSEETADSSISHIYICVQVLELEYTCIQSYIFMPTDMHKIIETSPLQKYTEKHRHRNADPHAYTHIHMGVWFILWLSSVQST